MQQPIVDALTLKLLVVFTVIFIVIVIVVIVFVVVDVLLQWARVDADHQLMLVPPPLSQE